MISPDSANVDYLERAKRVIPRGVTSSARLGHPLVVDRAEGSHIVDIAGNDYIDYIGGLGPMLLGHNPSYVIDRVRASLSSGIVFGRAHRSELELAERVTNIVPSAEMVNFLSTGSEAVHSAVATARGFTGRSRILKFEGHYHGWLSPLAVSLPDVVPSNQRPLVDPIGYPGYAPNSDVLIGRWNDVDSFDQIVAEYGESLAAVIMEPVACNGGNLVPDTGYLEHVRALCSEWGIVLIFDEVITGFRLALGGAQEKFGVTPDLTVLAKAIASGFPLSAVAGRAEVMQGAAEAGVPSRGTYNGHPVSMAAGMATMDHLQANASELYPRLEALSHRLADGIVTLTTDSEIPVAVNQVGSTLTVLWGAPRETRTFADVKKNDAGLVARFQSELAGRGVAIGGSGRWYVSTEHTDQEIDETLDAVEQATKAIAHR